MQWVENNLTNIRIFLQTSVFLPHGTMLTSLIRMLNMDVC
jgi:hypothetical protein